MALEIIKGFFAIQAAVHGFAGGGTKLADEFGMVRVTAWALHRFFSKHIGCAELLFGIGRGDAVRFQLPLAFCCHPIGGPGRRK